MKGELKANVGLPLAECTCCVCLEMVRVPRILSCGHHICLQCTQSTSIQTQHNTSINNNSSNHNNNNTNNISNIEKLRCPLCHKLTRLQDIQEEEKNQSIPDIVLCGHCEMEPATRECLHCVKPDVLPLCLDCSTSMHKGRVSSHTVNLLGLSQKRQDVERCGVHGKKKTFFCSEDLSVICAYCLADNHKGHNAEPVSNAAKTLFPKLQERLVNLPTVQQELKAIISKLDRCINVMLLEKTKQEQYVESAMSEIFLALEEAKGVIHKQITAFYNFQELLALRANTTSQLAVINTFQNSTQVEKLGELDVVRLYCSLPDLNKMDRTPPRMTTQTASKVNTKNMIDAIRCLQVLPSLKLDTRPELIVSTRIELDPSKEHSYSLLWITKGGVLTSSSAGSIILNVKILEIEVDGKLDFNGKGYAGGASVENEDTGHGKQGTSPTGVGIFAMTPNGGGGGGGQSNLAFGSAGGGGAGYGTVGSSAQPNKYKGGNYPGGRSGNTFGSPKLTFLHMGSGGGSAGSYYANKGGKGGNGGGALRINACKIINRGTISCNGEDGSAGTLYGSSGGGGSGGSIYLQAVELENSGTITAVGGQGGGCAPCPSNMSSKGGSGGHGRIRIDLPNKNIPLGNMVPQPYKG